MKLVQQQQKIQYIVEYRTDFIKSYTLHIMNDV